MPGLTVKLDEFCGHPSHSRAPFWLKTLALEPGRSWKGTRHHMWVYAFMLDLLSAPDLVMPALDAWLQVLEHVFTIKEAFDPELIKYGVSTGTPICEQ
ncbi:hypothetical protein ACG7TL_004953 [Trametes sanguinea]